MKKTKLTGIDPQEVSLVKRGANQRDFAVRKEDADNMKFAEILKKMAESKSGDETIDAEIESAIAKMDYNDVEGEALDGVKSALKILVAYKKDLPWGVLDQLAMIAGYGIDKEAFEKADKKKKTDMMTMIDDSDMSDDDKKKMKAKLLKKGDDSMPEDTKDKKPEGATPPTDTPANKPEPPKDTKPAGDATLTKEDVDRIVKESVEKATADLQEKLKKSEDARVMKELQDEAQRDFINCAPPAEIAALLKSAPTPEFADNLRKVLKAANERISQGNLFKEMGSANEGDVTLTAKINAAIAEVRKDFPGLTVEQAETKAYERNPSLYAEVRKAGN